MWSRDNLIARLASPEGFTNIGQLDRKLSAWLTRQRRSGRVMQVGWCWQFGRPVWGFAA